MKMIYVFDALCGWCYGFSPVITKLFEEYKDRFEFEVVSGGMMLHENAGRVSEEKSKYILGAIPRVEEFTGVQFGEAYKQQLADHTLYQSSLKPAIAIAVFKTYHPDQIVNFAAAIQSAQFKEGKDLEADQTYLDLISTTDIDANIFQKQLNNDEFVYEAQKDFNYAAELGVTGFPALIMKKDDKYYLLSRGYQPYESLQQIVEKVLSL